MAEVRNGKHGGLGWQGTPARVFPDPRWPGQSCKHNCPGNRDSYRILTRRSGGAARAGDTCLRLGPGSQPGCPSAGEGRPERDSRSAPSGWPRGGFSSLEGRFAELTGT